MFLTITFLLLVAIVVIGALYGVYTTLRGTSSPSSKDHMPVRKDRHFYDAETEA